MSGEVTPHYNTKSVKCQGYEEVRKMRLGEIFAAVFALGERSREITVQDGGSVAAVYVRGAYFGIYDYERKTFVD